MPSNSNSTSNPDPDSSRRSTAFDSDFDSDSDFENSPATVREAVPSDADAVRAVHRESILGLGTEAYARAQVEAWAAGCETADYAETIESDRTDVVVAEARGDDRRDGTERSSEPDENAPDVLAFGSLSFESSGSNESTVDAEVTAVYVRPSVARRGVGSSVLSALERRARARGVETLGLTASLNAVAFYESHGYERVREYDHEFSADRETGVDGRVVEMQTEL